MTSFPQIRVEPLVKVIAPTRFAAPEFPTVILFATVNLGLPLVANLNVAVPLPEPMDRLEQLALAVFIVKVTPELIVTVSPATGADPNQVSQLFQLPEFWAVLDAALAVEARARTVNNITIDLFIVFGNFFLILGAGFIKFFKNQVKRTGRDNDADATISATIS